MKSPNTITGLPGYETVKDLIPEGLFLHCTDIWRLVVEHYRDEADDLKLRMVLEMVPDVSSCSDTVALLMDSPTQITFPDSWQIIGLDLEDIRDRGMEGLRWRVYDYETSGFELYCGSIQLERRQRNQ